MSESQKFFNTCESVMAAAYAGEAPDEWGGSYLLSNQAMESGYPVVYCGLTPDDVPDFTEFKVFVESPTKCPPIMRADTKLTYKQKRDALSRHPAANEKARQFGVIQVFRDRQLFWNSHRGDLVFHGTFLLGWDGQKVQYLGDEQERIMASGDIYSCTDGKEAINGLEVSFGMQFMMPVQWIIGLTIESGPEIRIPSTPQQILQLLKLRDIPSGQKRRNALIHWVCGHSRHSRTDPEAAVEVRKHLRGARTAAAGELKFSITESVCDAEEHLAAYHNRKRQSAADEARLTQYLSNAKLQIR
jgi:hypothetical protein